MSNGNEYNLLLRKLDEFIRKYYKNRLLKGFLLTTASLLLAYLCIASLEYFGHFPSLVRSFLFYGFLLFTLGIVGKWILLPTVRLFRLGKTIEHKEAARIIGAHFPEVKDKLLNTLELYEQAERGKSTPGASKELIRASIDQRIEDLRPVPFSRAIDLSANRKYLKYALPPLLLFLILLFGAPNVLKDGTERIVAHGSHFEPEAPFHFKVNNDSLKVVEKKDFRLNVKIEGRQVPDKAYIRMNGSRFKLKKEGSNAFYHKFKGVKEDVSFHLTASGFSSKSYELRTLPDPRLVEFGIVADPPSYTGLERIERSNSGDLRVPEGTRIKWKFRTKQTEELLFTIGDSIYRPEQRGENSYRHIQRVYDDRSYRIRPQNRFVKDQEGIRYRIRVQKDRYPKIEVEEKADSLTEKKRYFRGRIEDDHGFTGLKFHYRAIRKGKGNAPVNRKDMKTMALSVPEEKTAEEFFHSWSLSELGISAGDRVEYYFSVTDNDRVNGPKTTRSQKMTYRAPTKQELRKEEEKTEKGIKKDLKEGIRESKELQKKISKIRKELLNKKNPGWKEKKKIEEAIDQQKSLKKKMEEIRKKRQRMEKKNAEFKEQNEELLKKQKKLEKLFDKVMSKKMKKTLKELQKKLDKMSRKELQKKMKEMKMSNKEMEKRLDRNLEMFKQLEFEKELQESIKRMKELKKEQKKLSEKSEQKASKKGEKRADSLKQKQDSLNKEFQKMRDQLDSLRKMDRKLENPNGMKNTEQKEQEIQKKMKKSSQKLQKGKKKDASKKQKGASKKMGKLSKSLQKMKKKMQQNTLKMNMRDLRELLNNLIELSFDQEKLMDRVKKANTEDPAYTDLGREQKRIREDFSKVKDSLYELSKQVFQLKASIDKQVEKADRNMRKGIDLLADRNPGKAASSQQYAMTALNELALLLDESLKSIQKKLAMKMPGKGNCQKPGGKGKGMPSLSQLRKMQKKLNQKMKQMQQGNKGKKKGGKGGKGKGGKKKGKKSGMSKKLAKMARRQAALRRKLQKLSQKLDPSGKGIGNELKRIAEKMEKTEKDIVEKSIDQETLKRQAKIKSRLLKSEKAKRKRGYKKERKAKEAKDQEYSNPEEFFEYKRKKEKEVEL
ncbi:MAG: DUF4175 family protein, partial [Flavobacteriales bacterium]